MNFGIAITELTSRMGVLSRKASMRLAEETGIKLVDKTREVGRALTKGEIEEVFAQNLPKRCRPTLVTTPEEAVPYVVKTGYTKEAALEQLTQPGIGAMNIPNGASRRPIFVPMDTYPSMTQAGAVSHELEHALETNCRPKFILQRKAGAFALKCMKNFDKVFNTSFQQKFMDKMKKLSMDSKRLEITLQSKNQTLNLLKQDAAGKFIDERTVLNCVDSKAGLAELNGKTEQEFSDGIRDTIREMLVSPGTYTSNARKRYRIWNKFMDIEKPAYATQGKVERYAYNMTEQEMAKGSGTAQVYDEAQKAARADRKLYLKNKLTGNLEKPTKYSGVKDIYKLVETKADKKIVKNIAKDMTEKERAQLFALIQRNPEFKPADIQEFLAATKVNGKSIYNECLSGVRNINPTAIKNPDFIEVAKLMGETYPAFFGELKVLSNKSPEHIKKFLEMAKAELKTTQHPNVSRKMAEYIDHPQFDRLKSIAEINIDGYKPYTDWVEKFENLSEKEIIEWETKLKQAAKEGKELTKEIGETYGSSYHISVSGSPFFLQFA